MLQACIIAHHNTTAEYLPLIDCMEVAYPQGGAAVLAAAKTCA